MRGVTMTGVRCVAWVVCAVLALLAAGCVTKDPFKTSQRAAATSQALPTAPVPADIGARNSPGYEFVAAALETAGHISTFDARTAMKVQDKRENVSLRITANILCARPDRMRLLASKVTKEVMEMSLVGESLDVWVPEKRTLHRGNLRELTGGDLDFHPDEIVGQLLFPVDRFLSTRWNVLERNGDHVLVESDGAFGHRNRLVIRTSDNTIQRHEIHTAAGELWLDATFDDYKPLEGIGGLYPRRIIMLFPIDERELTIVIREITVNPEVHQQDFWLFVPNEDVTVKSLKRTMRISDTGAAETEGQTAPAAQARE